LAPTVGTTGSGSADSPTPSSTNAKIDIDNAKIDTIAKIDINPAIDTAVGIVVPIYIDTVAKIDIDPAIDTAIGIAAPICTNISADIGIDATESGAVGLVLAANIIDPTSGASGSVSASTGGFDLAFGLFSFHVDGNGVAELISVGDSAPLMMTSSSPCQLIMGDSTSPVIESNPSATTPLASPAPLEKEPRLEELTPSVGSNGFEDPPPSPTTAYCDHCNAYH
jgi:hypothetical protein